MEAKRNIQLELASIVKTALRNHEKPDFGSESLPADLISGICNVLDAIFIHGLKDVHFVRAPGSSKHTEPNFWQFVSKFAHNSLINDIKQLSQIKTDIGRCRVCVRLVLNEGTMEHYITAILRERLAVRQFYHRYAFLRDSEQVEIMINYMKGFESKI